MISFRRPSTPKSLHSEPHPPPTTLPHFDRVLFFFVVAVVFGAISVAAQTIGEVYASDAAVKGSVQQTSAGLQVGSGSVITAGEHSASLRLARGGQVRICPRTNLTVNSSANGKQLLFAMSSGSFEGDYDLPATADSVLTPDFRILISGPAKVDLSITATNTGDACIRSRGNDSYVVVSELMGNDFFRVEPNQQVIFHAGHAKDPEVNNEMVCGCPAPAPVQVEQAQAPPPASATMPASNPEPVPVAAMPVPPVQPEIPVQPSLAEMAAAAHAVATEPTVAATANAVKALPPANANSGPVRVQIDAPMIYESSGIPPDLTATLARVHIDHLPWPDAPVVAAQPPVAPHEQKVAASGTRKKGFFRRLFRALFG